MVRGGSDKLSGLSLSWQGAARHTSYGVRALSRLLVNGHVRIFVSCFLAWSRCNVCGIGAHVHPFHTRWELLELPCTIIAVELRLKSLNVIGFVIFGQRRFAMFV